MLPLQCSRRQQLKGRSLAALRPGWQSTPWGVRSSVDSAAVTVALDDELSCICWGAAKISSNAMDEREAAVLSTDSVWLCATQCQFASAHSRYIPSKSFRLHIAQLAGALATDC